MKISVSLLVAVASLAGARAARPRDLTAVPYAPSPSSAPLVSLGYRELLADLLYVRMVGYFAAYDSTPSDTGAVAEAIAALDPQFRRAYEFGALALTDARREPEQASQLRAIALLERGMREFPDYWKLPYLAGQIYLVDLRTTDPSQRRAWDERGTALLESASRKPNAPGDIAVSAAQLQSKMGQKQRAIASLREILLITTDPTSRAQILEQLAKVSEAQSDELANELLDARQAFERQWKRERPAVPATIYILLGARLPATFDLTELATGGRDVIGSAPVETLEPLTDPPTSAGGPSSP